MATKRFSAALLSLLVVAVCGDINATRKEALKRVEALVADVMAEGNRANEELKTLPNRVVAFRDHIANQGLRIKDHNVVEIADEAKASYQKADVAEAKNAVYGCIAHAANDGEVKIRNAYFNTFCVDTQKDYQATAGNQSRTIENWRADVAAKESNYRKQYIDATSEISAATNETKIAAVVNQFAVATNNLRTTVLGLHVALQKIQLSYVARMQGYSYALRQTLIAAKNEVFASIKACFNIKRFLLEC